MAEHLLVDQAIGMALEQLGHDLMNSAPLRRQLDAHRASVNLASLMVHIAHFNKLLEIIADIGALIVTTGLQFPRRHFVVANIEKQECLHRVDLQHSNPLELVLDDVQQEPVQTLYKCERLQVS